VKFVSWNVNGLRACVQKGFLDFFNEMEADFFCVQETKLQEGQIDLALDGYAQYWNYAVKKGYSGTAIFTKHTPLAVTYGLGIEEHDQEGRVITLEYADFYLVTVYTPNSQNELARLDYRMRWETDFRKHLMSLDKQKPVIVCGDLNVAHKEIDLKNPKTNRKNAGFTDEERGKFQDLLDTGFTDSYRHFYPDQTGIYSWWSYRFKAREKNAGWRIDYFCVSERLNGQLQSADIHTEILGSDHCPVEVDIAI
jgi:exodeoxyribonuclease III